MRVRCPFLFAQRAFHRRHFKEQSQMNTQVDMHSTTRLHENWSSLHRQRKETTYGNLIFLIQRVVWVEILMEAKAFTKRLPRLLHRSIRDSAQSLRIVRPASQHAHDARQGSYDGVSERSHRLRMEFELTPLQQSVWELACQLGMGLDGLRCNWKWTRKGRSWPLD